MRKLNVVRAAMVAVVLIAANNIAAQPCAVTLTDVTDYTTWQSDTSPNGLNHFYTFQAVGTGNIDQVYLYAPSVQGRFNLYCGTKDFCQMFAFCVTPGSYQMNAYAYCADGTEATPQHLPLIVSDERPDHWITGVTPLGGTQYRVDAVFRVPAGQNTVGPEWDVFKRLPDGTFSTEYGRFFIPTVTAAPGDRVDVFFGTCGDLPGIPYSKVVTTYIPAPLSIEVAVLDGNGQGAVVGEPAEKPLRVKFTASDPNFKLASLTALFEVITVPSGATGQGVGANENSVAQTYSVSVAADGTAGAKFVAGNMAGAYVVRVKSPMSLTGSQVLFTTTAQKPDSVAVLKDSTDMADKASTYAVSSDRPTTFFAVGLDKAGQKIGPLKCAWSLKASGSGATRGGGTVSPATAVATTSFTPTNAGQIAISAKSPIKGVSDGKADLFVTSLYVSIDNTFSAASRVDQSALFVPGSYLDGSYVALDLMQQTGQFISLHVVTGPGAKGAVTFNVDPSHFAGIAMNFPITGADTSADMQFTNKQTSISVPFAANGDTWTTLLVKDYGAIGTISVKIAAGKSTYTLAPRRLPVDNGSGLPAAGWFVHGTRISVSGLKAVDDLDDQQPSTGANGDGLSAFEEFRGFIVGGGTYTRLDPRTKDVFIDIDQPLLLQWNAINMLGNLPLSVHYVDPGQTKSVDLPDRVERASGEIDPNRAGIPGAPLLGQRVMRVVYQDKHPPVYFDAANNRSYEVWRVNLAGITLPDEFVNVYVFNTFGNTGLVHSPNKVQFAEVYPAAFNNMALRTAFNRAYTDAAGNPVSDCGTVPDPNVVQCDDRKTINGTPALIVPHPRPLVSLGIELRDLYTALNPGYTNEFYSAYATTCGGLAENFVSESLMDVMRTTSIGHEVGHNVHMAHTSVCGNIMFTSGTQSYVNVLPIPTVYQQINLDQIQLFEP